MKIELRGVTKRYGARAALSGVTLELPSGSRTAMIGPNGSGKSTLARVIARLVRAEGEVLYDGRPPADETALLRRIAYLPQIAPRIQAPADELVEAICALRGLDPARVWTLAGELGLGAAAARGTDFQDLSGGMKQKLMLALSIAQRAELMILDEPTASLDPDARERFFAAFAALPPETTVLLSSHRIEELRALAGRVLILDEGRIAFLGEAGGFLRERSTARIEVRCRPGAAATAWLRDAGFARGAGDRWRLETPAERKMAMIQQLIGALGAAVEDLQVHEAERLDAEREESVA
jgi:ABC-2 type transport system ATP-binding protein